MRRQRVAAAVVIWWTAFGIMSALQYRQMAAAEARSISWSAALVPAMASAWLWIPATWLALFVTRRFPIGASSIRRSLLAHGIATLTLVVLRAVFVIGLNDVAHWYRVVPPFSAVLVTSAFNNIFFYWLITAAAHAVYYAENARVREMQLKTAQLNTIAAQLQPHFLFNALNTITALIYENQGAAERAVVKLSDLLRETVDVTGREMVPLKDELRLLANYLELEQARFEDRLSINWSIPGETTDALVPHFVLQPLVLLLVASLSSQPISVLKQNCAFSYRQLMARSAFLF